MDPEDASPAKGEKPAEDCKQDEGEVKENDEIDEGLKDHR
jgi:hypothetical protein